MGIAVSGIVLTFDHQGQPLEREYRPEDVADNEHGGVLIGRQNHTGSLLNLEPVEVAGEVASDIEGDDGSTSLGGYLTEDGKANFVSPVMSRCHAFIFFDGDTKVAIRDEDSHHGTYIERAGREPFRVESPESTLRTGDTIIFGRTVHKAGQAFDPLRAKVKILYKLTRARRASSSHPTSYGLPEDMDDVGSEDLEDLSSGSSDAESSSSSSVDSTFSLEEDPDEPPVLKAPVSVVLGRFPEVHELHSTCGTPSSTRAERCSVAGDLSVPGGYDEDAWLGVGPLPTMMAVPVPVEEPAVQLPSLGNQSNMCGWVDRVGQVALEQVIEDFVPEAVTTPEYIDVDEEVSPAPAPARSGTPSDMDIEIIDDDKSTGAEGQDELDDADDDEIVEIPALEVGQRISPHWTPEPLVSPIPFNNGVDLFPGMKRPWRHLENSMFTPQPPLHYQVYCGTSMVPPVPYTKPPITLPPILSGNLSSAPPSNMLTSNMFGPSLFPATDSSPVRLQTTTEPKPADTLPTDEAGPSRQEQRTFEKDKEALALDLKKAAAIGKELEDMMSNWKKSVEDRNKDQGSLKEEMAEVKDYIRMLRGSKDRARVREKRHRKATDDTFNDIREELQTLKLFINEALTKLSNLEKEGDSKDELKALSENIREVASDLGDLRVTVRTDFSDLKGHHASMVGEIEDLRERYGASRETTRELTTSLKRKFDVVEYELIEAAVKCQERIEQAADGVKTPAPPVERKTKRSRLASYSAAVAIGAVATYVGLGFL